MAGGTMGQGQHGSATTSAAVRRAIQHSQESLRALAKRYGVNQKTVAKWRKRTSHADLPTGPREPRSTVLSIEQEADRKSTRLNSSHANISYAVFCLKKQNHNFVRARLIAPLLADC